MFIDAADVERHLYELRRERLAAKMRGTDAAVARKSLTVAEKNAVLAKTGGCCHVCGGLLNEKWVVAHVVPHAYGGGHGIENLLPAHASCNGARWFYGSEEFQWIIKMGVYFRTQFEELDNPSAWTLAQQFVEHEQRKIKRRRNGRASVSSAQENGDVGAKP
ncbi:HNH endonuclease [Azohydromonas aeria]|uniref:HNH endonuclease n=1 Tax=Azohydromonas aeria TaxID=2590212 RepID=UPI0012F81841|nr:HNH endonuclease [Azohydromonas aeria]